MEEEIWKDIEGYEGYYQVSNLGRIRSVDREITSKLGITRIFKGQIIHLFYNVDGYLIARLCKNSQIKEFKVHRLVAKAFVPNFENKPEVSHLDETRDNNKSDNLCWATYSENRNMPLYKNRHSKAVTNGKNGRAIPVICENKIFDSGTECAIYYSVKPDTMLNWLQFPNKMPIEWQNKGLRKLDINALDKGVDIWNELYESKERIV